MRKTRALWGAAWILRPSPPRTVTKILRVSRTVWISAMRWRRSPLGDQWGRGSQVTGVCETKAVVAACYRSGGLLRKARPGQSSLFLVWFPSLPIFWRQLGNFLMQILTFYQQTLRAPWRAPLLITSEALPKTLFCFVAVDYR